ncbi:MAG: HRDC domain-containing protein [Chthoniobacter sp.]|nr:HRDC domain-containing protein [Chthoniobacter sp.]
MHPLIDTPDALAGVLPMLAPHARIPIDTEADSLHCYFEKLCLIQISVPEQDLLIDPLAAIDLTLLFHALDGKQLVIHGADYDLRLLRRVGFPGPSSVFDTMLAARLAGVTEFSLAALILKYFGVTIAKASQKANWALRPLPPQMSDYAVKDTHYLLEIATILEAELVRLGRTEWHRQACEKAIAASMITKDRDPDEVWRISGSHELRGRSGAVLRALWHWRDQEAQAVDKPAFHILHNEQLLRAAADFDAGKDVSFHHLHGGRKQRFYTTAEQGLAVPEAEWPRRERTPRPRPTPDFDRRLKELRTRRDQHAQELQLDPSLIAPKTVLENLAANNPDILTKMMPWQRELLGV